MNKSLIIILLFLPVFIFGQEKININTATLEQLDILAGIGPAYAQRIIDNRPFSSVDDLLKVSGIGEKTLQKIKEQGLAYIEERLTEPEPIIEVEPQSSKIVKIESTEARPLWIYESGVFFNEIMPSPVGPDSENEWIKLYNSNNSEIDLSGWIIKDTTGSIKEYVLDNTILALEYLTLGRPKTKITLNNDGDSLILLNPNGETVDSVNFGKAVQGESYIKNNSKWAWTTPPKSVEVKPRTTRTISTQKEQEKLTEVGPQEVKLVEELEGSSKISVLFIGFLIAFCSAIAFLIVKNNLKNFWY